MDEPFLGEIQLFSLNFAPMGWTQCSGQTLQISQNQALYSLLGTNYGGDGITNFQLPDLRGAVPFQQPYMMYYICISGVYPVRS